MSFAILSAMALSNSRLKISLLTIGLAAVFIPAQAHASCSNSTGNPVVTTCTGSGISVSGTVGASEGSSISVSGIPATVASMSITLNSLALTGSNGGGLNSVAMVLVSPSGAALDFLSGVCNEPSSTFTIVDSSDTGTDNLNGMLPLNGVGTCGSLSGNYYPSDFYPGGDTFNSPGPSSYDSGGNSDNGSGTYSFTSAFGLPASASNMNGTWTLYIATQEGGEYAPSGSLGSWSIAFTTEPGTSTTTSLAASPNGSSLSSPVYTNSNVDGQSTSGTSVTLTATVSPNPGGGTVNFYDSTGGPLGSDSPGSGTSLGSASVNASTGKATLNYTFTGSQEGLRTISAAFGGFSTYVASTTTPSGEATVLTVNHPYNPSTDTYCNGPVAINDNPSSADGTGGFPYPSQLIVPTISGTIEALTLTVNGLQVQDPNFTGLMLQAPNGTGFEFMSWADGNGPGGDPASLTNTTVVLADGGSGLLQTNSQGTDGQQSCTSGSPCKPADDYVQVVPLYNDSFPSPSSPFTAPTSIGKAYPTGSSTFTSQFGGAGATGTWLLYANNWLSENASNNSNIPYGQIGSWCLAFTMQANAHATTTALSASPNPVSITSGTTGSTTLTATVTVTDGTPFSDNPSPGSVTFVDGSTTLGTANISDSGVATLSVSLTEGTHQIVASYSGTSSGTEFGISSATLDLRVNTATTASGTGAGPYTFCNSGSIVAPATGYDDGPALPYPSNIFVSGLPGTVKATTVTLNDFTTRDQGGLLSLLVGPGGTNDQYNLDFFSLTGSNVSTAPSPFNLTFEDGGSAISTTNLTGGGPYEPSSKNTTPLTYPQCASNATLCGTQDVGPPLGSSSTFTPSNEATSAGGAIFGDATHTGVFGGDTTSTYNGNGTWSLYIDDSPGGAGEDTSITGGWCLGLTVNLPSIGFNGQSASTFTQGGTGSLPAIVITNNGIGGNGEVGPIGDPTQTTANAMKVVDVLPTGLTFTNRNGSTDWSCAAAGQTVTCTNEDSVAVNASYSDLTLNVSVSGTATGNIGNNTVSVSDAEAANTPGQAVAAITVDSPPTISSANSTTFTTGTAGSFSITSTPGFPTTAATLEISNVANAIPGVNLPSSGTGSISISGTPTGSGVETFTITATNGAGLQATQDFTLTVNQAPSITSASSTTFVTGTAGSFTITSTPGYPTTTATLQISNVANAIPGVNLPSSGTGSISITGTPTGSGVETFTITATNSAGLTNTQNFTLTVNQAPAITSASSTAFVVGTAGSFSITSSPGFPTTAATLAISNVANAIPGVNLPSSGTGSISITGTPTASGVETFTITATNGASLTGTQNFTLTVNQAPSITSASSTTFEENLAGSFTITSSPGFPTSAATLAVSNVQNAIAGVNLPSSGSGSITISGTPTGAGTETFTVTATNGASLTNMQNFTLTVAPPVNISPGSCPTFTEGSPASCTLNASGGVGAITLAVSNLQNPVAGLNVPSSGTGSLSIGGTPTATGTETFTLTATDSLGGTNAQGYSLNVQLPQYQLTTSANPSAGGTVTPASGGIYSQGTVVPLVATPATGYTFLNWTSAADPVASSTSASTTITMNNAESVTANFTPNLVVTTNGDADSGMASNCTPQATPGVDTQDSACSLRDALTFAKDAGSGNISFSSTAFTAGNPAENIITLVNGTLAVYPNTTITGPTSGAGYTLANLVTINGGGSSNNFPVFTVLSSPNNPATISGLTITNANDTTENAGGILIGYQGTLTLLNSSVVGNYGGGIASFYGTSLTIDNCNISGNTAGVGIVNENGTLTVNSTTVSGNASTGILVGGGTAAVTNSTITGNGNIATNYSGGGVNNYDNSGTVTLANNIVAGNTAQTSRDIAGAYTDAGGNLIPGVNGVTLANLNLAPLGPYGGPTQTILPLPGSVAICGGLLNNATSAAPASQQISAASASPPLTAQPIRSTRAQCRPTMRLPSPLSPQPFPHPSQFHPRLWSG
jgi:hypothetical protein